MRSVVGFILLLVVVALVFPFTPWVETLPSLFSQLSTVPIWHIVLLTVLSLSGLLFPPHPDTHPSVQTTMRFRSVLLFGIGGLLLLEPFLLLITLGLANTAVNERLFSLILPNPNESAFSLLAVVWWVVLPACIEEWVFRKRLFDWLRPIVGTASTVSLTALLFAVAHGNALQALLALPIGLLLGVMRVRQQRVLPCIIVHAVHNVLLLSLNSLFVYPFVAPVLFIIGIWLIVIALGCLYPRTPRFNKWLYLGSVSCMLFCIAAIPTWKRLQTGLWVSAAHRHVIHKRVPVTLIIDRLSQLSGTPIMTADRHNGLCKQLQIQPAQDDLRQALVLATLDPVVLEQWATETSIGVEDALFLLIESGEVHVFIDDAIRRLAIHYPEDFGIVAGEYPQALIWLFPYETYREHLVAFLAHTSYPQRARLARSLFVAFGEDVLVELMLSIPASRVGIQDRHCLLRLYKGTDGLERIRAHVEKHPELQTAWWAH